MERFTSPPEDSLPLLHLYFRSLVTGTLKPCWCPVLYVVTVSHVNAFIFSQDAAAQVQNWIIRPVVHEVCCTALTEVFRLFINVFIKDCAFRPQLNRCCLAKAEAATAATHRGLDSWVSCVFSNGFMHFFCIKHELIGPTNHQHFCVCKTHILLINRHGASSELVSEIPLGSFVILNIDSSHGMWFI